AEGQSAPFPPSPLTRFGQPCRCRVHASRGSSLVALSGYTAKAGPGPAAEATAETVAPTRTLDGFGVLGPPPSTAKPLHADYSERATAEHPPGLYGPPEGPLAVNAVAPSDKITALDTLALRRRHATYQTAEPRDIRGMLLAAALALFLVDALVVALLGGGLARLWRRRRTIAAASVLAFAFAALGVQPTPTRAADD